MTIISSTKVKPFSLSLLFFLTSFMAPTSLKKFFVVFTSSKGRANIFRRPFDSSCAGKGAKRSEKIF
ncbi:MAG: hypothetical protein DSZ24_06350 [Thermodesulfatator sp.]|nr:MAG: hypothetical protein DSZ24_06350 [Thermodesulfatator sp.]